MNTLQKVLVIGGTAIVIAGASMYLFIDDSGENPPNLGDEQQGVDWEGEVDKKINEIEVDKIFEDAAIEEWEQRLDEAFADMEKEKISQEVLKEMDSILDDQLTEQDKILLGQYEYIGAWKKIASYVAGKQEEHAVSYIYFSSNHYISRSTCTVEGGVVADKVFMKMAIDFDGCTGGVAPKNYVMNYSLSKDKKILTLSSSQYGIEVKDVFERMNY